MLNKQTLTKINDSVISHSFSSTPDTLQFLSMKDVMSILGKSRSTVNRWIVLGTLPKPIKLGENSIVWPAEVISAWRENMITQSNSTVRG